MESRTRNYHVVAFAVRGDVRRKDLLEVEEGVSSIAASVWLVAPGLGEVLEQKRRVRDEDASVSRISYIQYILRICECIPFLVLQTPVESPD